ncbi:hypothetical protein BRADI_4g32817v3 [Brachypodium distachyon]|uniref:Endonuclease/exonuclease/phosphatase domain-containing protein n=1 Tax=Brachypodium distachyon TaxID=15368 RepID=A0A2K2CRW6_BRADI|nr:hypothetical protein BRADI_4g32817v3 [Brachypodium distachyon]
MDCKGLSFLVWNVRGLNDPGRCRAIRAIILKSGAAVVALCESKLELVTSFDINAMLGPRFDGFDYLPASGTRGGIVIAWQSSLVCLDSFVQGVFSLSARVCPSGEAPWWISVVYGPTCDLLKPAVVRDFNLLLDPEDKNNLQVRRSWIRRFRLVINELALKDAPLIGRDC